VLQIARLSVEIRMIMKPTSRDKIERSVVIQEPIPSILAIGQCRCHSGKAAFCIRVPRRPRRRNRVACDYRTGKMNVNLLVGRSLLFRAQRRSRSVDRKELSLAFVRHAAISCQDPNVARDLTRSVSDPSFSNLPSRALVSQRHREIVRRTNRFAPCTVSDEQGYSAAKCNSASGRTV
jgi:hypothetical protein